jgi:hypothetical protein
MSDATKSPSSPVDRKSSAGSTPNPWEVCARLEYGGDRSFAWSVREQVIHSRPEDRGRIEDRLLTALGQPDCTDAGRAFLCEMIAMVGSARSVPALAPLLRDPRSTESARYALQAIPGAEASAALRDALGALSGAAKAGLIGSIALRHDTAARAAFGALERNAAEPAIVREAASRALTHLATLKA